MKIRVNSGGFQIKFRWVSRGSEMIFRGFSGGFPMKFQIGFRAVSEGSQMIFIGFQTSQSDTHQNVFRVYKSYSAESIELAMEV